MPRFVVLGLNRDDESPRALPGFHTCLVDWLI